MSELQLAREANCSPDLVARALQELEEAGLGASNPEGWRSALLFELRHATPALEPRREVTKVCEGCQAEFHTIDVRARYCSPACKQAAWRNRRGATTTAVTDVTERYGSSVTSVTGPPQGFSPTPPFPNPRDDDPGGTGRARVERSPHEATASAMIARMRTSIYVNSPQRRTLVQLLGQYPTDLVQAAIDTADAANAGRPIDYAAKVLTNNHADEALKVKGKRNGHAPDAQSRRAARAATREYAQDDDALPVVVAGGKDDRGRS